jgi:hypothetical protein
VAFRFARRITGDEDLPVVFVQGIAGTGTFGTKFRYNGTGEGMKLGGPAKKVLTPENDELGCEGARYPKVNGSASFVALVTRGNCTFFEKVMVARASGAIGIIVSGASETDKQILIRPSADEEEHDAVKDAGVVYVLHAAGEMVRAALDEGRVWVQFGDVDALDDGDWETDRGDRVEQDGRMDGRSGLMIGGLPIGNLEFADP